MDSCGEVPRRPSRRSPKRLRTSSSHVAFAGVPPSPDLEWLRSCVPFLVARDA